jgi:hypothetical protein
MRTLYVVLGFAALTFVGCGKSPEARREELISLVERKVQHDLPYEDHSTRIVHAKISDPYLCVYVNAAGDPLARYASSFAQEQDVLGAAKQVGLTTIVMHNGLRSNEIDTVTGTSQMRTDALPSGCK